MQELDRVRIIATGMTGTKKIFNCLKDEIEPLGE